MALKSTIFKANLQVSDMDRHHYGEYTLTIAQHPSENDHRMMVRALVFALNASETLAFGKGLSEDSEPDLWEKDLTGAIKKWIDVGLPDEKLIRKACGRADQVMLYTYVGRAADLWWDQNSRKLKQLDNLSVINLSDTSTQEIAKFAQKSMQLQCTIQDQQIWFSGGEETVQVELTILKTT